MNPFLPRASTSNSIEKSLLHEEVRYYLNNQQMNIASNVITLFAMDISKIIPALDSETRREIIKILGKGPSTVKDVFQEIKKTQKVSVRYRESIYRALEKLVNAGLVEKYYDKEKGICYNLLMRKIKLDLVEGTAEKAE